MRAINRNTGVIAVALSFFLPALAAAQTSPAAQAAENLARAQAQDLKCSFLAAHERDKLSKFTARAELALASHETAEATKAAMQRGRDAGGAAACTADEKSKVQALLAAALQAAGEEKQAAKLAAKPAPVAADAASAQDIAAKAWPTLKDTSPDDQQADVPLAPEPAQAAPIVPASASAEADPAPVVTAEPKLASAEPPLAPAPKPPAPHAAKKLPHVAAIAARKPMAGLTTYEKLTQAYFMARRCGGNQGAAYQAVVAEHGRVMQSHSAAEVSASLHRAEARAGIGRCS